MDQLQLGKIIINFDESHIQETYSRKYSWFKANGDTGKTISVRVAGLQINAFIGSDGLLMYNI